MTFQLQSKPLVGKLKEAFPEKTSYRELSYKELKSVMTTAPKEWAVEAVAAASLGVDLDALTTLPGRFAGAIGELLADVIKMHGLNTDDDESLAPAGGANKTASVPPKH